LSYSWRYRRCEAFFHGLTLPQPVYRRRELPRDLRISESEFFQKDDTGAFENLSGNDWEKTISSGR
jgi:hypothetical protein